MAPIESKSSARRDRRVFGDVQTPLTLAMEVTRWLAATLEAPHAVLEPTCGVGAFLEAARTTWPRVRLSGFDLSEAYLRSARAFIPDAELKRGDAFATDWALWVRCQPGPVLVLGNPPWSTTAVQGRDRAHNRPAASDHPGGLDAITGASNFDVSEWLTRRLLEALRPGDALALLLKKSVVRKLLDWSGADRLETCTVDLDARRAFDAAVDAQLFVARPGPRRHLHYRTFDDPAPTELQPRLGAWVEDASRIDEARIGEMRRGSPWRSGLKHDCRRIFELTPGAPGRWSSELEQDIALEPEVVHPLLKCTDLAHGREPGRAVLVTQHHLRDDPARLSEEAPLAWAYLQRHRAHADARRSRVYRGRPAFVQFGVGRYTFARHKVAVSGLHWPPRFRALCPFGGRPVLLDDTCYFLEVGDAAMSEALAAWLNAPATLRSLEAFTDPQAKRPVTQRLLSRLRLPWSSEGFSVRL